METKHKSDLKWAIMQIDNANTSFDMESERFYLNSARARLDNALRHDSDFLPALFLKAQASPRREKDVLQNYQKVLDYKPTTKARISRVYFELANFYADEYFTGTEEVNLKNPKRLKAIEYAKKSFDVMPNENAIELLQEFNINTEELEKRLKQWD